jgi:phage terminase large subunit GpA-like protein
MDIFTQAEIEEIVICSGAQIGKTETIFNCLGYVIDQDQAPALLVYPTKDIARTVSSDRIRPAIRSCPTLKEKYDENNSEKLNLSFLGMNIYLAGANSASELASKPIRYLFLDEIDKYPAYIGKEGDPIKLATERTKSFHNKKIIKVSTPSIEKGNIWSEFKTADVRLYYYVPCPHCGEMQKLKFPQVKWPDELTEAFNDAQGDKETVARIAQKILTSTWYECEHCGLRIEDKLKQEMLRSGEWRLEDGEPFEGGARKVAFHVNSLYSPWVTFGDAAAEFLTSKDYPEKLRNFINSWLGEPWVAKAKSTKPHELLSKKWTHERGVVPKDALLLTAGIDVQKDHFWWEIKAFGEQETSWTVDYGRAETWQDIERIIIDGQFRGEDGDWWQVRMCLIDSGYRTDEVYQFCAIHPDICKPSKGSSKPLKSPYLISNIENQNVGLLKLFMVDTNYYKDFIEGRRQKEPGEPGAWMLFNGEDRDLQLFVDHVTSEVKVTVLDRRTGAEHEEWQLISSHAQNHLLDCDVYSTCAAEVCGIRYLRQEISEPEPVAQAPKQALTPPKPRPKPKSNWALGGRSWR